MKLFNFISKLSAVRKVLETLGSKLSHGTSSKFADVRTHLRKVSEKMLNEKNFFNTFRCSDSCR